ncbi:hypothetical protein PIB30_047169 [Stylosanthes scabra]|uniref:Transposase MuDR plant domain-containing protein n=1 Tax=Stylosanthes scabra TaxID=79078 RepID=A0ABU6ZFF6_9FABA|nr:hypothetical protein [Stylosanthes scabra]
MANFLVSQDSKHCHVYDVSGFWQGICVEITTNDEDYVASDVDYSSGKNGMIEVQFVSELEYSSEEEIFDNSANDCRHDDQFGFEVEGEDKGANVFRGLGGPLNEEENNVNGDVDSDAVAGVDDEGKVGDISSSYETESLDSYYDGDSDDSIRRMRYPKYNEVEMSAAYEFRLGLEFKSIAEFKEAIKKHTLLNGRGIEYVNNDKVRCRVSDTPARVVMLSFVVV